MTMKKQYIIILLVITTVMAGCKKDFLDKYPEDRLVDQTFWSSENNVRTFAYGFYTAYFTGYGSGYTWGRYFSGQSLNDDFAPTTPPQFIKEVPASGGGWSFTWVRKANLFIDRVSNATALDDQQKAHWVGVGRFFRALEYNDLSQAFGDVPWYDSALTEKSPQLYKARDPLGVVVDNIQADLQFAVDNIRENDGVNGVTVNRQVAAAFMSRIMLYYGTYFKYHNIDQERSKKYLQAATEAAKVVMNSGRYSITDNYRSVFNSVDLNGRKEVILYRRYEPGILTHSLHSYVNKEPQTGVSKDFVESYLMNDGLPITVSPLYKGDKTIADVMADRDNRIKETLAQELRLNGHAANYSTTGYAVIKFFNEALKDLPEGSSNLNTTDAPVIRFGEVLMNYAEARAELDSLTQEDLDMTINKLRKRPGINMPNLEIIGGMPAVNGVTYTDPEKDADVSSLLWEIRRERRIELALEGFRLDDLKRWKKLEKTDTQANKDINLGAWINKSDWPKLKDVYLENGAEVGYIMPARAEITQRLFVDPKVYLNPIPLDQIKLYSENGAVLTQNPGW